jgi:hypothetical protein
VTDVNYTLLITDQFLTVVGDPITCWTSIDVTLKFNEPSAGIFTAPGYSWIREQMAPGNRVVVIRGGEILIAGPIEKWMYERSDDGDNAGAGTLTVTFADDLALVVARSSFPNPNLAVEAQVADNWTFVGLAEDAMRSLVDTQAGPNALAARQVPQLSLGIWSGLGPSSTYKAELMEPVGNVLRRIAVSAGGLGFRTRQEGTSVLFEVYQPENLANQVVFGFGAGSLKYIGYEVSAPSTTVALVGGQGEGADRLVIERVNAGGQAQWGRMETLVSRPGSDPTADLQAAGDQQLASDAETVRIPTSTADTPFQMFGRDYRLGSQVSVETWPGSMVVDVIVTVHIQVYPTAGEVVSSTVGSQAAVSDPKWIQRMRQLDQRVSYLERNVVPAAV